MLNPQFCYISQPTNGYWNEPTFYGWPIITTRGPLLTNHLEAISRTLQRALVSMSRVYAVRFDLRLPSEADIHDTDVITRFFIALRRLLEAADVEKTKVGKRVHPHQLRYCWVREWGAEGRPHYHVLVLLNRDRYRTLGSFQNDCGNLSARIKLAWSIAVNQSLQSAARLVYFPQNAEYQMNRNSAEYMQHVQDLFYRVSYFAKAETKVFGIGQRSFGASKS